MALADSGVRSDIGKLEKRVLHFPGCENFLKSNFLRISSPSFEVEGTMLENSFF